MNHIYLDANATTRLDPSVLQSMLECYQYGYVNPASQHQPGQLARRELERARQSISANLGAGPADRLLFTSGGTEANNLAIFGLANFGPTNAFGRVGSSVLTENGQDLGQIIVSSIEHPSVLAAADFLAMQGFQVHKLPVSRDGLVLVDALQDLISADTRLVSLMMANNETGVIQDVARAAEICNQYQVPLHCDAVQAVGKLPFDFKSLGIAAVSLTAHKLQGPRGIGGLLIANDIEIQPMLFGGFQQLGQRPGTQDVALAVGFAKAVDLATNDQSNSYREMGELRDLFESEVLQHISGAVIIGKTERRLPHTSCLGFPAAQIGSESFEAVDRQALLMAVDAAGVAISTGSACASGSSDPSHVLMAMGLADDVVGSSVRISLDRQTCRADILRGAECIINATKHLRLGKRHQK